MTPASTYLFKLACHRHARLVADGKMSLINAADQLQRLAVKTGVIGRIGQDFVQRQMVEALKPVRWST